MASAIDHDPRLHGAPLPGAPAGAERPVRDPVPGPTTRRRQDDRSEAAARVLGPTPADDWQLADPLAMGWLVRRALRGLIQAACPLDDGPQFPGAVDRVEHQVRTLMAYMHPLLAQGLCAVFLLLDLAPIWRGRGWRRISSVVGRDRDSALAVLRDLQHSRNGLIQQMMVALRATVLTAYYDQPEVHFSMGYHPVPWIRDRIARRRELMAQRTDEGQITKATAGSMRATVGAQA